MFGAALAPESPGQPSLPRPPDTPTQAMGGTALMVPFTCHVGPPNIAPRGLEGPLCGPPAWLPWAQALWLCVAQKTQQPCCQAFKFLLLTRASLVPQLVKNLPTACETWVQSLGWEDALEKGKATHSSILAWRIPWTV